jgi:hypothetical protein
MLKQETTGMQGIITAHKKKTAQPNGIHDKSTRYDSITIVTLVQGLAKEESILSNS